MNATIAINAEHKGIEISFDEKPARRTLDALKAQGFRWHNTKKLWYAKNSAERMNIATALVGAENYAAQIRDEEPAEVDLPAKTHEAAEKKAPANKFGVKVGDVFCVSWGYEQTNIDFYQVVALRGTTQAVFRRIGSEIARSIGFMSHMVKPVRDAWRADETFVRTVKGDSSTPYCSHKHGLMWLTDWDTEHNETSYY